MHVHVYIQIRMQMHRSRIDTDIVQDIRRNRDTAKDIGIDLDMHTCIKT